MINTSDWKASADRLFSEFVELNGRNPFMSEVRQLLIELTKAHIKKTGFLEDLKNVESFVDQFLKEN